MITWTFDIKFPLSTEFTFGSLTFAVGEDEDLKILPPGSALEHLTPAPSSTSGSTCSGLDPFCRVIHSYHQTRSGYSNCDVHPPAIHRSTEFVFIGIVHQPRFI
jgi:hypothetical protein